MYIVTAARLHNKEEQAHCAAEPIGLSHDYNTFCVAWRGVAWRGTHELGIQYNLLSKKAMTIILLQFKETVMSSKYKQN